MGDKGFAHPAEAEAGQRDAELGGRQGGIEFLGGRQGKLDPPTTRFGHGLELAGAHFDQRELGGHEKTVRRNQEQNN